MARFDSRYAAVTGAASGNGRAIAEKLLEQGAKVAALGLNTKALDEVFGDNPNVLRVECDVADEGSTRNAMDEVASEFGRLDVLVNNAGIVKFGTFDELSREEWDQVFAVNSTGPFLVSRHAAPSGAGNCCAQGMLNTPGRSSTSLRSRPTL